MEYVRIYTDEHGETHFEDVAPPTTRERYASAAWLISSRVPVRGCTSGGSPRSTPRRRTWPPRRQFIVHLAGEAEIEVSDGETRRFGPGSVLLVEDVTGRGHTTRRVGDAVRETLFLPLEE